MIRCAAVAVLVLFLSACESEGVKQPHFYSHRYYLKQCVEQTYQGDNIRFELGKDVGLRQVENRQWAHDFSGAECMAGKEKTSVEYQKDKHDDYGKVCGVNEKWSYGSCIPK